MVIRKRGKGRFKTDDEYNKIGRDFREVVVNYFNYTTKIELILFIGLPIILAGSMFLYLVIINTPKVQLLNYIMELNKNSLTVVAILAGFNTTSLSIIAASNNKVLKYLRSVKHNESNDTILKQLVTYFSFAIVLQLIVLIIGITLLVFMQSIEYLDIFLPLKSNLKLILLSLLGASWFSVVLFSISLSIRNSTLLFRYVLFIADFNEEEN